MRREPRLWPSWRAKQRCCAGALAQASQHRRRRLAHAATPLPALRAPPSIGAGPPPYVSLPVAHASGNVGQVGSRDVDPGLRGFPLGKASLGSEPKLPVAHAASHDLSSRGAVGSGRVVAAAVCQSARRRRHACVAVVTFTAPIRTPSMMMVRRFACAGCACSAMGGRRSRRGRRSESFAKQCNPFPCANVCAEIAVLHRNG